MRHVILLLTLAVSMPAHASFTDTSPYISIIAPPTGSLINGTVTLSIGTVPRTGRTPTDTEISIDGGSFANISGSSLHSLNTASLRDGAHTFVVRGIDNLNETYVSSPATFFVDSTPPTITNLTVVYPAGQTVVRPGQSLTFKATILDDRAFIDTRDVRVKAFNTVYLMNDSGTNGDAVAGDHVFSRSITIAIESGATQDSIFEVHAADTAPFLAFSNRETVSSTFTIDSSAPVIRRTITTDPDTIYANGQTIIIHAYADSDLVWPGEAGLIVSADFSAVDSQWVTGAEVVAENGPGTYVIRYTISASNTLRDGTDSVVTITVRDTAGNLTRTTWKVTLNNTSPVFRIQSPPSGAVVNGSQTLILQGDAPSGKAIVDTAISIDGGNYVTTTTGGSHTLATNGLADGTHNIRLRGLTAAGDSYFSDNFTYIVDSTPPAITNLTVVYPAGQTVVRPGQSITFRATIFDDRAFIDTRDVRVKAFNTVYLMNDSGTNGDAVAGDHVFSRSITIAIESGATQDTIFEVHAADTRPYFSSSNRETVSGTFSIDSSAPVIRRTITTDPDTIYANGQTIIIHAYADSDLNWPGEAGLIVSADFSAVDSQWVTGAEVVAENGPGTYVIRYTISASNTLRDGTDSVVTITVRDTAGNLTRTTWKVTLNNTTPVFRIQSPPSGAVVNGSQTLILQGDAPSGKAIVDTAISIDGGNYVTTTTGGSHTLATNGLADGTHNIRLRGLTAAGDSYFSDNFTYIVDSTPPAITNLTVVYPAGQTVVRPGQSITFRATIFDAAGFIDTRDVRVKAFNTVYLMNDSGTNGDAVAGDHVFSRSITIAIESGATQDTIFEVHAADTRPYFSSSNRETVSGTFTIDSSAPVIRRTITTDPDTIYANGQTIIIHAYADSDLNWPGEAGLTVSADFSAIDSQWVTGAAVVAENGPGTYVIRYTISASNTLRDGTDSVVTITVRDSAGNQTQTTWKVTLNNTTPVFRIQSPPSGAVVNGSQTLILQGDAPSGKTIVDTAISIDGGNYVTTTTGGSHTLATNGLADGTHNIRLRGLTAAGDSYFSDNFTYIVDSTPPAITNLTVVYPAGQTVVRPGQSITFRATIFDAAGFIDTRDVRVKAFNTVYLMNDSGTNGDAVAGDHVFSRSITIAIESGATQDTIFEVHAADTRPYFSSSNRETVSGTFTIDSSAPVIRRTITTDPDTIYANGQTIIIHAYADSDLNWPGEAGLTVSADFSAIDSQWVTGAAVVAENGPGTYVIRYTISASNTLRDGTDSVVTITVRDSAGNQTQTTWKVTLNNTTPVFRIANPPTGSVVNGAHTLILQGDAPSGKAIVDTAISIDGGNYVTTTTGGSHNLSTSGLADGTHIFRLRGLTASGDSYFSDNFIYIVDSTPPAISNLTVIYPAGQTVARPGQSITFRATIFDARAYIDTTDVRVKAFNTVYLMNDSGTNGDAVAGDHVFSRSITIAIESGATQDTIFEVHAADTRPYFSSSNRETVSGTFTIDSSAPVIRRTITTDPDTVYANGQTIIIHAYADSDLNWPGEAGLTVSADFSAIDSQWVTGAAVVAENGPGTYVIRYTISASNTLRDGTDSVVTITVRDSAGNQTLTTWKVTLNNTTPVFRIANPPTGSVVNGAHTLILQGDAPSGKAIVDTAISIDGGNYVTTTTGGSHNLSTSGLADGTHIFRLRGLTASGDSYFSENFIYIIDSTPPAISNLTVVYPSGQTGVRPGQTLTFKATIHDDRAPIDTTDVRVKAFNTVYLMNDSGTGGDAVAGDHVFSRSITVAFDSGATQDTIFEVHAADTRPYFSAPNRETVASSFRIDSSAPVILYAGSADEDTIYSNGQTVTLFIYVDSDASGGGESGLIISADFSSLDGRYAAGTEISADDRSGTYVIRYTIATNNSKGDGPDSRIIIEVRDGVGLLDTHVWTVSLSNLGSSAPSVLYVELTDTQQGTDSARDNFINDNDTVIVSIRSATLTIVGAEYFVDFLGRDSEGIAMSTFDGAFDSRTETAVARLDISGLGLQDGFHTLMVHGRDSTGVWGSYAPETFTIDRAGPVISIVNVLYPRSPTEVKTGDTLLITAFVSDVTTRVDTVWLDVTALNGETGYQMFDNGASGDAVSGDRVYSRLVNVSRVRTATVTCTVSANDVVRNASSVAFSVTKDDSAPRILSTTKVDADTTYQNGEPIRIQIFVDSDGVGPGDSGVRVGIDFTPVDNNYVNGAEIISESVGGVPGFYTILYTISRNNIRLDQTDTILTIIVADRAGNTDSNTFKVTLDNLIASQPYTVSVDLTDSQIGTDSARDNIINDNDSVVVVVADTTLAPGSAEYFIDVIRGNGEGISLGPQDGLFDSTTETTVATLDISPLADGLHYIFAHARDSEGRFGAYVTETFTVDRVGPVVRFLGVTYQGGATAAAVGSIITFSAQVSDVTTRTDTVWIDAPGVNGQYAIQMLDDGSNGDMIAGDGVYTVRVTDTAIATSTVTCTIAASDIVRNTSTFTFSVLKDDSPPVIRSLSTLDVDTVYRNGQTITLRALIDTDLAGVGETGLTVTADFSQVDAGYVAAGVSVTDLGAGNYAIRYVISQPSNLGDSNDSRVIITARDAAGNQDSRIWTVSLDNNGPVARLVDLSDSQTGTDSARDNIINDDDSVAVDLFDTTQSVFAAEYFIDFTGRDGEGTAMAALDGRYDGAQESSVILLRIDNLAEGLHTFYAHGQDTSGNWGPYGTETFVIDRYGPVISTVRVDYPNNATSVSAGGAVTVSAHIIDAVTRVDTVWLDAPALNGQNAIRMVDDGTGGDAVSGDNVFTVRVTCTAALTATVTCTVAANDIVRNRTSVAVNVVKNDSRPVIRTITTTDPDTIYRNGQTITLRVFIDTDGAGAGPSGQTVTADFVLVDSTYIAGSERVSDDTGGFYTIRYTIATTNPRSDRNDTAVVVSVRDGVGGSDSMTWLVSLDNNAPVVALIDLSDPQTGNDRAKDNLINDNDTITISIRDTTSPVLAIEYFIDLVGRDGEGTSVAAQDGRYDSTTETGVAAIAVTPLLEGAHTLYAHGQDTAGAWGPYSTETFVIDRAGPMIQNVTASWGSRPLPRDADTITISALVRDLTTSVDTVYLSSVNLSTADTIRMLDDGRNGDVAAGDNVYTCRFLLSTSAFSGETSFTVVASDTVRNTSTVTDSLDIFNTPETPTITSVRAQDTDRIYVVGATIKLIVTVTFGGQPIAGLRVTADFSRIDTTYVTGSEVVADSGDGTYLIRYTLAHNNSVPNTESIQVIVRAVKDGTYFDTRSILLELRNGAGDFTAPDSAAITEPLANASFNKSVRIRAYASDELGLDRIEFWRVSPPGDTLRIGTINLAGTPVNARADMVWDVTNETQGIHQLFIIAFDRGENFRHSIYVPIQVDRTVPTFQSITIENTAGFSTRTFSNGETIVLKVRTNEPGDTVSVDFSPIDSNFKPGDAAIIRAFGLAAGAAAAGADAVARTARALADTGGIFEIHYKLTAGNTRPSGIYNIPITITDSAGNTTTLYAALTLQSNSASLPSPNPYTADKPFVPGDLTTGITFRPLEPGGSVEIFNLKGNLVQKIATTTNYAHWDVRDRSQHEVASGYYIYIIRNPSGTQFRGKLAIVR